MDVSNHEVLNGTPTHEPEDQSNDEQLEATQKDETTKVSQKGNEEKGQPRKKEITATKTSRVLRSRSQEKPKVPESVDASPQDAESKEKKRKKIKKIKKDQSDEFSKIRTSLKYLLSRMNYEQLFIEAYAGEGWKGQSLEKLRPEKELERAKSDITRYKVRIRDLFQRIDRSCEEGRFPESLYDSDGLIDSEDIFCAKCAQTEVRLDNDIILCDGYCDRGFHQYCLDPPLLKEQVPPGDEGWLCPACDCKVDCVDLLNDSQGTDLSINDSWEKVFPETAASGNKLDDISNLPSDDSEDDDYNPDGVEVENDADVEDSSSDESNDSNVSAASGDFGVIANNNNHQNDLDLPSDDSEDDDFNPDEADSNEEGKNKSSSSDFSSDYNDLADISKNEEVTSPEVQETPETDMENDDSAPITAKRNVERLDYKKLHDEAYGNVSSDESDEDFSDGEGSKKRKNIKGGKGITDINQKKKESDSTAPGRRSGKKVKESESNTPVKRSGKEVKESDCTTPVKSNGKKVDVEGSPASTGGSKGKSGNKSSGRKLGEAVTQRLYEIFKENHYPDRNTKENLTKELNLTHAQVSKWFENARWSFNHPGQTRGRAGKSPSTPNTSNTVENPAENGAKSAPSKSKKKQANNSADSPMDLSNQSGRRVRAKRL